MKTAPSKRMKNIGDDDGVDFSIESQAIDESDQPYSLQCAHVSHFNTEIENLKKGAARPSIACVWLVVMFSPNLWFCWNA